MLPISAILANCPNLVSLDIKQPGVADFTSLPMRSWPKLTELMMFSRSGTIITCDHIHAIGKRFPSLKHLRLYPCRDMHAASVILDYYPWMNDLFFLKAGCEFAITYFQDEEPGSKGIGLRDICIHVGYPKGDPWRNVSYILLRQHRETLECIDMKVNACNEDEKIYGIGFPCLKKLCITNGKGWIPRNAPMLEELEITYNTPAAVSTVLDTVPPKLKKLKVHMDLSLPIGDNASFERYLHQLAQHS